MFRPGTLFVPSLTAILLALPGCGSSEGEGEIAAGGPSAAEIRAAGAAPEPEAKLEIPRRLVPKVPPPDPDLPFNQALRDALAIRELEERIPALVALLPTLGPEAIPQVRASLESFEDKLSELGAAEYELLMDFWSEHDAAGAAHYAMFESPMGYRIATARRPVQRWSREDPEAASQAFLQLASVPGPIGEVVETGLVVGWFESGQPGLQEFMYTLPLGAVRQRAVALYTRMLARNDGGEAVERWLEGLPDEDSRYKQIAFRQAGSSLAMEDLDYALAFCEKHCEGPWGRSVRGRIAKHYATQDGAAAMAWLATAPAGEERDRAVRQAFSGWYQADRTSARAWLEEQRKGGIAPYLSPAYAIYAGVLAREEGRPGVELALEIPDPKQRTATLLNVARQWRAKDPEAADAWLETSPLDEQQRQNVRNPPRGPGFEPEAADG